MTSDPTPPSNTTSSAKPSGALIPLLLFLVAIFAAGAVALYIITVKNPRDLAEKGTKDRLMFMTGLNNPVQNKLSDQFTDADGDLIADPPTDAAKLIDPPKLIFAYIAVEDAEKYEQQWKPFTDHLSKVTGKPVEYLRVMTTDDQLKALRDGALHVTGLNSGAVPMAANLCGFVPVARIPTSDAAGVHMEIIVPADSAIQNIADFKDRKFTLTLTEPNSNSGFKAPMVLLHEKGIEPERDYLFSTSNGHPASIEAIASRESQAAAVASDMLARAESREIIKKDQYRSIYRSADFPSAAIGFAYNLKPDLAAKVRQAITEFDLKSTSLETELAPLTTTKLIPVDYKTDWAVIRKIDDACGTVHELK